jgi:heat shock protein HtpX
VDALSQRAGVPAPRLWLVPSGRANAFAMGRGPETASIAVTEGLLEDLGTREVAGVLAHELAHIKNRDILLSSFAATVTSLLFSAGRTLGFLALLALPLLLAWAPHVLLAVALLAVAPVIAVLLQAALSRQRELAADAEAAALTGDPLGLASALSRLELSERSLLWLLFGRPRPADSPLASHPRTEERVERLLRMAPPPERLLA